MIGFHGINTWKQHKQINNIISALLIDTAGITQTCQHSSQIETDVDIETSLPSAHN